MRRVTLLLVLLAALAHADVYDGSQKSVGLLATAQIADGVSANSVDLGRHARYRGLVVTYRTSAGTATVTVEQSCDGAVFFTVPNSSASLTTTANGGIQLNNPACEYRTRVASCSSCSVTATYVLLPGAP